jgi:putative addiction module CopG family antidote
MKVTLTEELEMLVKKKVRSGRYVDESDVVRDALRALELRDDYESPGLEAVMLEGVRSAHRPYGKATLDRVRKSAQRNR